MSRQCSTCRGSGEIKCRQCDGTGTIIKIGFLGKETEETCYICKGNRYLKCPACEGSGKIED